MKYRTGRHSNHSEPLHDADMSSDYLEQSEKSLLREALGRPLGILSLFLLFAAVSAFAANHFMWTMDRVSDYALVAIFVSGGLLLSILLRSGDSRTRRPKANRQMRGNPLHEDEIGLGVINNRAEDDMVIGLHRDRGFAEASPAGAPIPMAAMQKVPEVDSSDQDDEMAGYERALIHYAEKGDLHGQGEILRRLGHVAKGRGHLNESREFYLKSRDCFKKTDDQYAEAAVLLDLGQVMESLGDHDLASAAYRDANRALLDVAMNTTSNRDRVIHAQAAD